MSVSFYVLVVELGKSRLNCIVSMIVRQRRVLFTAVISQVMRPTSRAMFIRWPALLELLAKMAKLYFTVYVLSGIVYRSGI